ncbi:SDR family oxidoreductase [Nocardia cyriacigeorgica]|uniref:SDR family oxidoreductase n=1 Tax=Nocardia cyriacigeorgica TaxID=135487 RepID=UPI00189343C3|nr:SDR family oxidoreductase [Nocardia cyriacigeorgica]MBF6101663.1 SDR family oxidoreductase [Nocardia cyriacigeorgica]MBF6319066.1 SDR family oxidoreductase [Nocardia cyriacigeorgica]MBF6513674.1 SDR family oxidoreductase [Nocardia cyriacigeorgica]MBF6531423.1 SDR family oxidoreductase [Nocardia cyriacigeorgica]
MFMNVSGQRVVVVTGAAAGIGAATARRFASESHTVALWDRDPRVHRIAGEIAATAACSVIAAEVDLTDATAVDAAFDALVTEYGAPDVVAHAAGIMRAGSALEITAQEWDTSLAVNATATMLVTQRAAREMVAAGRGSIVVVSSNAAAAPRVGMAAYCASKAAATAFTRALALQVAPHGVRVNLVSPGSTDTAMLRGLYADDDRPLDATARTALLDGDAHAYRLGIPLRRIATADDIAAAVRFLASAEARHITMHDLRVDGGATLDM